MRVGCEKETIVLNLIILISTTAIAAIQSDTKWLTKNGNTFLGILHRHNAYFYC